MPCLGIWFSGFWLDLILRKGVYFWWDSCLQIVGDQYTWRWQVIASTQDTAGTLLPVIVATQVCDSMTWTSAIAVASTQSYLPSPDLSPWVRNWGRLGRKDLVAQQDWLSSARTQVWVYLYRSWHDISLSFTLKIATSHCETLVLNASLDCFQKASQNFLKQRNCCCWQPIHMISSFLSSLPICPPAPGWNL